MKLDSFGWSLVLQSHIIEKGFDYSILSKILLLSIPVAPDSSTLRKGFPSRSFPKASYQEGAAPKCQGLPLHRENKRKKFQGLELRVAMEWRRVRGKAEPGSEFQSLDVVEMNELANAFDLYLI